MIPKRESAENVAVCVSVGEVGTVTAVCVSVDAVDALGMVDAVGVVDGVGVCVGSCPVEPGVP